MTGLTTWYLSSLKILKYSVLNCYIVIGLFLILNIIIYLKNKDARLDKEKIKNILISENIFLVIFIVFAYIRSFSPTVDFSTEKFMNYAFLNQLFNSEYMPANDMWFSGFTINYYYFGQYIASFLTKVSFSRIQEGFNLAVITVNTFTFVGPLIIGYNLGKYLINNEDNNWLAKKIPCIISLLSAVAVSLGGTLLYPINRIEFNKTGEQYYYWDDTRYIGYRPETNDKTINEIVPYSNMVGDLHAHHIDTMFVFFTLAMLLKLLLEDKKSSNVQRLLSFNIITLGLVLGIQKMTNYWDFPIYLVVIGITLIFNNFTKYKFNRKNVIITMIQLFEIVLIEELVTLPFSLNFHISATKVLPTNITSPFYKLAILWGLQTLCVVLHIVYLLIKFIKQKTKKKFFTQLFDYISNINKTDLFIFIIGCCAIGLIIIPEIVYVKDIYADEYKRANTMYKLCYQADIMFDIATSYILVNLIYKNKNKIIKILCSLLLLAFMTTFGYGIYAIGYTTNNFNRENTYSLDDVEGYLRSYYPDEYNVVQWIKKNIDRNEVILEKATGSYNLSGYISVFTGNPNVLAWHGHEWIWRANADYGVPPEEDIRWKDTHALYSYSNVKRMKEVLDKYNVSYVYVSEEQEIPQYKKENLESVADIVYEYNGINRKTYIYTESKVNAQ